jgi:hypothetical protein
MYPHMKRSIQLETEMKKDPGEQERIRAHVAAPEIKYSVRTKGKKDPGEQ